MRRKKGMDKHGGMAFLTRSGIYEDEKHHMKEGRR